jgi:RNA-directed DNA polymerase
VHQAICKGYTQVLDTDLCKYFDTITHHGLMQSVAWRVVDPSILTLIKRWLNVPVVEQAEEHIQY